MEDIMGMRRSRRPFQAPRLSLPPVRNIDESVAGPSHHSLPPSRNRSSSEIEGRPMSRYHAGCLTKNSIFMDWSTGAVDKTTKMNIQSSITRKEVKEFLDKNKAYLENYILKYMHADDVHVVYFKKLDLLKEPVPKKPPRVTTNVARKEFKELLKSLQHMDSDKKVAYQLACVLAHHVKADGYRLFKLNPDQTFVQYVHANDGTSCRCCELIKVAETHGTFLLSLAKKATIRRMPVGENRSNFPDIPHTIFNLSTPEGIEQQNNKLDANYVMYLPILAGGGETSYLVELLRTDDKFTDKDEKACLSLLKWGSLAMYYCNMYLNKSRERNMTDFLLDVIRSMFEHMVSLENVIKRILEFAQRLVQADRASLFIVDHRNNQLVSTVFDLTYEKNPNDVERREIRIPMGRGIAGHVALSGESMNIPDAYSDSRFNRSVDEETGYRTISILCMPIKVRGKVIGVVQMVNKIGETSFDHQDEDSFEIFSNFFGLALHHANLYDRIKRKEQKYRVTLEVLGYHNTCREIEVDATLKDLDLVTIPLDDFYLNPYELTEFQKCQTAIKMFNNLFDMKDFDNETVARFVLTVKKNYRTVPYHNFDHGWSVANAMYVVLKNDVNNRFDYTMRLALFVASLCHDLDHRGYTNKYMSETASPLAAMYTTSTLEHHHFNITVTILQQDGHNIFSSMSGSQYKRVLGLIKHCILATDLAVFFPNIAKMKELYDEASPNTFEWRIASHRELAMAISMTAADLSAASKPWDVQIQTVKVIFEEFYDQGDKERLAGRTPIPMMNRTMTHEQPGCQVGFLSQICVPCYSMLYRILPNTEPMFLMVLKNLQNWKTLAEKQDKEKKKAADKDPNVNETSMAGQSSAVAPDVPKVNDNNDGDGDDDNDVSNCIKKGNQNASYGGLVDDSEDSDDSSDADDAFDEIVQEVDYDEIYNVPDKVAYK